MNLATASMSPTTGQDKMKYLHKLVHKQLWNRLDTFFPQTVGCLKCWNWQHEGKEGTREKVTQPG